MRYGIALLTSLFVLAPPSLAHAEVVRFTGVLEIQASVGVSVDSFQLLSVDVTGAAEIDGGVVRIDAGEFSAVVPNVSGFGGTLVNGPATFSAAGGGPGSSCPLGTGSGALFAAANCGGSPGPGAAEGSAPSNERSSTHQAAPAAEAATPTRSAARR